MDVLDSGLDPFLNEDFIQARKRLHPSPNRQLLLKLDNMLFQNDCPKDLFDRPIYARIMHQIREEFKMTEK